MTTTTTTLAAKYRSHLLIRASPARQSESVINKHLSLSFCCDLSPPENQIETGVRPRMETDDINMMDMRVVIGYRGCIFQKLWIADLSPWRTWPSSQKCVHTSAKKRTPPYLLGKGCTGGSNWIRGMRTKPSPDFGGPALRPAKRDNVTLDGLITFD